MPGQIEALLHEMERHILAGRAERVAAIKRELAELGHVFEGEPVIPIETTSAPAAPENTSAPRASETSAPTAQRGAVMAETEKGEAERLPEEAVASPQPPAPAQ